MKSLIQKKYLLRQNMMAIIGICLSAYFCYHLVAGPRGYFKLASLERQVASVSAEYDAVKTQRESVEKKVVMMRPGSIDRDLLEERIRYILGYGEADEIILRQDRS